MKSKYDDKRINSKKSAETLRLKKWRRLVLLAWLLVAVAVGILVYNNYAKDRLADTPNVAIERDTGVSTGTELDKDKTFGPWDD